MEPRDWTQFQIQQGQPGSKAKRQSEGSRGGKTKRNLRQPRAGGSLLKAPAWSAMKGGAPSEVAQQDSAQWLWSFSFLGTQGWGLRWGPSCGHSEEGFLLFESGFKQWSKKKFFFIIKRTLAGYIFISLQNRYVLVTLSWWATEFRNQFKVSLCAFQIPDEVLVMKLWGR